MTIEELPRLKWTLEEYHQLIQLGILADKRVELLRGEIVEMVPEGEVHSEQSQSTDRYLTALLQDRAWVRHAKPITLNNGSEPEPDITLCHPLGREHRLHHPYPENIFWVIEYSNATLKKDLGVKAGVYAEVGIQEYWIVNVQKNELIVMRDPEQGQYRTQFTLKTGTISPVAFSDLKVDVLRMISP